MEELYLDDREVSLAVKELKKLIYTEKTIVDDLQSKLKEAYSKLSSLENAYKIIDISVQKELESKIANSIYTTKIEPTSEFIEVLGNKEVK